MATKIENGQLIGKCESGHVPNGTRITYEHPIEFFTNYTKMPIVAFSSLLCENKKKNPVIKCYPQWE